MASVVAACAGLACVAAAVPPVSANRADSYYYYCLSRQSWYRQELGEAIRHLRRAIDADPGSSELPMDLARLQLELNEPAEAVKSARRAVDLAPESAAARAVLAESLYTMAQREETNGDLNEEALKAYRDLIRLDPEDAEAHLSVARLLMARGSLGEALESLQRHLALAPLSDEGIYLSAQALSRLNRHAEARELLEGAIARRPDNVQLRLALVEVLETEGQPDRALQAARPLLHMRAEPIRVQYTLARLSQKLGLHSDAFAHFSEMGRLMEQHPAEFSENDRAEVQVKMVQELLLADRAEEALAQARSASARYPKDARFALKSGEALLDLGRDGDADKLFRERISANRSDPTLVAQVSETYLAAGARRERAGDLPEAEKHLKRSIELNPENADALNYLGYMLADRGERLDEAIGYIKRALERDPQNGAYLDSLGWAYFKKRDYERAEVALRGALEVMSDVPEIHAHLGDLYQATGRTEQAVDAWQEALNRGVPKADEIRARMQAAREAAGLP